MPSRALPAVALLLMALALLVLSPDQARAQATGTLSPARPTYNDAGIASAVFMAGPLNELEAAARLAEANGVWVQDSDGSFHLLVVGGPTFINAGFRTRFAHGFFAPIAVTLTRASAPPAAIIEAPPISTLPACPAGSRPTVAARSVVQVVTTSEPGTAFYIGDGEWLTAERVVRGLIRVRLKSDVLAREAVVVGVDRDHDVAVLRTEPVALDGLRIATPSQADAGIEIWSIGFPLGLEGTPTLTRGTLSRIAVLGGTEFVQTDAAVNPGNSGGPLTDGCGVVLGLTRGVAPLFGTGAGFALSGGAISAAVSTARTTGALTPPPPDPRGAEVTAAFRPHVTQMDTLASRIVGLDGVARLNSTYPAHASALLDIRTELLTLRDQIDVFANPAAYAPACASLVERARAATVALADYAELTALDWSDYPTATRERSRSIAASMWRLARDQVDIDLRICPSQ